MRKPLHPPARVLLKWLVLAIAVGFPRAMVIGGYPSTDEGVYAYFAQLAHTSLAAGRGLPATGMLSAYPTLLSWVFAIHANPLVVLRAVDMLVALAAGALLYDVLVAESRNEAAGAVIAFIALFAMNQPIFIQSGFKNSAFAALIPLLLAVRQVQRRPAANATWYAVGALCALSLLLRETFAPFAALAILAALAVGGRVALARCVCAMAVTGLVLLLLIVLARGGVQSLIEGYRDQAVLYQALSSDRWPLFEDAARESAKGTWLLLAISSLSSAGILLTLVRPGRREHARRSAFWLGVAGVPLIEPLAKIGFPYHFSICIPGLAALAAVGWRAWASGRSAVVRRGVLAVVIGLAATNGWHKASMLGSGWESSAATLRAAAAATWPADSWQRSNYLLGARLIRAHAGHEATVSVSGFMFALYPITGLLPPAYRLANLTAELIRLGMDADALSAELSDCPPDLILTTTRTDWPGRDLVTRAIVDTRLYEPIDQLPIDPNNSYGYFGGTLYRRVSPSPVTCRFAGPPRA